MGVRVGLSGSDDAPVWRLWPQTGARARHIWLKRQGSTDHCVGMNSIPHHVTVFLFSVMLFLCVNRHRIGLL